MKVLAADAPLVIKPTPYTASKTDAVVFDSVPGSGFETNPMAAAIVPPACAISGSGAHLSINPAETNAFRAINAAWKAERVSEPRRRSLCDQRHERTRR